MPSAGRAVILFAAISLPQPWECFFCHEVTVAFLLNTSPGRKGPRLNNPALHHIDGNHDNNDPSNWAWAHQKCHSRHHGKFPRRPMSEETKAKIGAASLGRKISIEARQRIGAASRERFKSQEARDRAREYGARAKKTPM